MCLDNYVSDTEDVVLTLGNLPLQTRDVVRNFHYTGTNHGVDLWAINVAVGPIQL
jgi:hypothetical protein